MSTWSRDSNTTFCARWLRLALSLVALAAFTLISPSVGLAIDQHAAALALAKMAAEAYESGHHQEAARLYLEAFHVDPSQPDFVYGAARAEQSAGQLDQAEGHFKQFAALPSANPLRIAKAKTYLLQLLGIKADGKVAAAEQEAKKGDHALAATLFVQAFNLSADRHQLLVRAALEERECGNVPVAKAHLQQYLHGAPADAAERDTALSLLQHLGGTLEMQANSPATPGTVQPAAIAATTADVTVHITTRPTGAQVEIDGIARGTTPLSLFLAPGRHRMALRLAGMKPEEHDVEVPANKPKLQLDFAVAAPKTRLQVTARAADGSSIDGLTVKVDGKSVGTSPWQGDVTPGQHTVTIERKGKTAWTSQVQGHAGETLQLGFGERDEVDLGVVEVQRNRPGVFYILSRSSVPFAWRPQASDGPTNQGLQTLAQAELNITKQIKDLQKERQQRIQVIEAEHAPKAAVEATVADFRKRIDALEVQQREARTRAIAAYHQAFAANPQALAADHWFVRAELCYEQVFVDYNAAMDAYERQPHSAQAGPKEPTRDFRPCIQMLDAYSAAFPTDTWVTAANYLGAYEVAEMEDYAEFRKRAGTGMVIADSPYAAELSLRLAEIEFDAGQPGEALPAYQFAMKLAAARREYSTAILAAYKAAWSAWLLGDNAGLLDGLAALTQQQDAQGGQSQIDLVSEIAGIVADTLIRNPPLMTHLAVLQPHVRATVAAAAGRLAAESEDWAQAVAWWALAATLAADDPHAADWAWQTALALPYLGRHAEAATRLQAWGKQYGEGSPWLAKHPEARDEVAKKIAQLPQTLAKASALVATPPGTWWAAAKNLYGQRLIPAYNFCEAMVKPGANLGDWASLRIELRWSALGGKPQVAVRADDSLRRTGRCIEERLGDAVFDPHQAATVRATLRLAP